MHSRGSWQAAVAVVGLVVAAIVTNVATGVVPKSWGPYLWLAWPLLGAFTIVQVVVAVRGKRAEAHNPEISAWQREHSRQAMLGNLTEKWIDGVLGHSFYEGVRIEVTLERRPDLVSNPWAVADHSSDEAPRQVSANATLISILHGHAAVQSRREFSVPVPARSMLILGDPGSGKTTMLQELLRDLLVEAVADSTHPIPVLFRLASWSGEDRSLADWLVDEMCANDGVSREISATWVAEDQILPLLDGLDEVPLEHRAICAQAISEFRNTHGQIPLVVTSRLGDYVTLGRKLGFQVALLAMPLMQSQVDTYLAGFGSAQDGLRKTVATDRALRELLVTPFLLSIAVRAYERLPESDVTTSDGSLDERQSRLIRDFVDRSLRHRSYLESISDRQVICWLAYMARDLAVRLQPMFYVEFVTSDWLPRRKVRATIALTRLTGLLPVFGFFFICLLGVLGWWKALSVAVLLSTPAYWLIGRPGHKLLPPPIGNPLARMFEGSFRFSLGFLLGGMIGIILSSIPVWLHIMKDDQLQSDLANAFAEAGIILGAIFICEANQKYDRRNPEDLPVGGSVMAEVKFFVESTLIIGILVVTVAQFFGWRPALAAVFLTLASTYSLSGSKLVDYWYTRAILARDGIAPWRFLAFLGYAVSRGLLLKVGSGHQFRHRLLLEYFAQLEIAGVPEGYVGEGLPLSDIRPERLLESARKLAVAREFDKALAVLRYAGAYLPPKIFVPAALDVAEMMRPSPDPRNNFSPKGVDRYASVYRLAVDAELPDLSVKAAASAAEFLATATAENPHAEQAWRNMSRSFYRIAIDSGDHDIIRRVAESLVDDAFVVEYRRFVKWEAGNSILKTIGDVWRARR